MISSIDAVNPAPVQKPDYVVNWNGQDWVRFTYDTGAVTSVAPSEMAEGVPLEKVGEFIGASGDKIPNYGKVVWQPVDSEGSERCVKVSMTTVHKPLGAGRDVARNHDTILWQNGGMAIPRHHPIARG